MNLSGFQLDAIKRARQLSTFNGAALSPAFPTTLYVTLTIGNPVLRSGGYGQGEVTGTNYARVAMPCTSAYWTVNNTGQVVNAVQINFPVPGLVLNNTTVTATTPGASSNVITFSNAFKPSGSDVGGSFVVTGGTNINPGTYTVQSISGQSWTVTGLTTLTTAAGPGSAIVGSMAATWPQATGLSLVDAAIGGNQWYSCFINPVTYLQTSTPHIAAGALVIQE
ncbi:MAG: hypothetical protein NVSMB14_01770 [Isosphaeraceae bacterium]